MVLLPLIFRNLYLSMSLHANYVHEIPSVNGHKKKYLEAPSFDFVAPALWNALPPKLIICDTIESFKKNLKTILFTS